MRSRTPWLAQAATALCRTDTQFSLNSSALISENERRRVVVDGQGHNVSADAAVVAGRAVSRDAIFDAVDVAERLGVQAQILAWGWRSKRAARAGDYSDIRRESPSRFLQQCGGLGRVGSAKRLATTARVAPMLNQRPPVTGGQSAPD